MPCYVKTFWIGIYSAVNGKNVMQILIIWVNYEKNKKQKGVLFMKHRVSATAYVKYHPHQMTQTGVD